MITLIIIIAVIVIIISVGGSKSKPQNTNVLTEEQLKQEMIKAITDNIKITVTTNTHNVRDKHYDSSIIDVSNEACQIITQTSDNILTKYPNGVPYWSHTYIYSAAELNYASKEQQRFYFVYKTNFLSGVCLDTEDNSNYAFILLFDLFVDFETHKDLEKLKDQIKRLGEAYPKTKSYGTSFLVDLIRKQSSDRDALFEEAAKIVIESDQCFISTLQRRLSIGFNRTERIMDQLEQAGIVSASSDGYSRKVLVNNISQIKFLQSTEVEDSLVRDFPDYHWSRGQKYGEKLGLNSDERKILDMIPLYGDTNFTRIDFFHSEIIRLCVRSYKQIQKEYQAKESSLEDQLRLICDSIVRKQYGSIERGEYYNWYMQSATSNIHQKIYRICENITREHYGHKRITQTDNYCTNNEIVDSFGLNIYERFSIEFLNHINTLSVITEDAAIELNSINTTRWKIEFAKILEQIDVFPPNEYIEEVLKLGRLNKKNPSLENIYYEASKCIAKRDKTASLKLYMYYIEADLKSSTFDNKQLTKTIQKNLFSTQEQIEEFEDIISEFISTKNFNIALEKVSTFYTPKRKRIEIDMNHIKDVQEQHSQTVKLLNEYLQDDEDTRITPMDNIEEDEATINIEVQNGNANNHLVAVESISFTNIQLQVLDLFVKGNLNIDFPELSDFAKQNGYFVNQLVDSINDLCYDAIDDLLIEEDGECYVINEQYFKMIIKQ